MQEYKYQRGDKIIISYHKNRFAKPIEIETTIIRPSFIINDQIKSYVVEIPDETGYGIITEDNIIGKVEQG